MNLFERIQDLCTENNTNPSKLEQELGFGKGTLYKWKTSSPNSDKLQAIADHFGVTLDYLKGNSEYRNEEELFSHWEEKQIKSSTSPLKLSSKDEKDISKRLDAILDDLNEGALMFDGEVLDDHTAELLKQSLENSLRLGKTLAKQKFTPKKYN